jgi:glycosyltransferase involved in cell wall biosynthesis
MGLPVTSGYHTHFDQYSGHYGLRWLAPLVTRSLDALHRRCRATLVPAPELASALSERGIPNVQVVGRGVDTSLFNPTRRSPDLRRQWGVDENADQEGLACLYVGRLAPEKNLDTVVRAFSAIADKRPDARMIWVGDGPAMESLRSAHPDHIFAGSRTGVDLATHYASADLFLFASLSETWGNVIGEAMASGLGVVAYRRAAASSLIRDGENGLSPSPGDEMAFVSTSLKLAEDSDLRLRLGRQASTDLTQNAWSGILDRLEVVLEQSRTPRG